MTNQQRARIIEHMNSLEVPPNCLAIWGLGQMGVALKGDSGGLVYIDPCLSDVVEEQVPNLADKFGRAFPPPIAPEQITNATLVLCSHEHLDHTDPLTLAPIATASPAAKFLITDWSQDALAEAGIPADRTVVLREHAPLQFGAITVIPVPSAHTEREHVPGRGDRWLGFLMQWNGVTFYHTGDTIIYPGYIDTLRALPHADIALVCANGRDAYRDSFGITGNMNPTEVAWLASEMNWDVLLGGHNDLYPFNTVGAGELPDALRRLHPRQKFHTLQPGELYLYVRP